MRSLRRWNPAAERRTLALIQDARRVLGNERRSVSPAVGFRNPVALSRRMIANRRNIASSKYVAWQSAGSA
jgi:hypothetical protein